MKEQIHGVIIKLKVSQKRIGDVSLCKSKLKVWNKKFVSESSETVTSVVFIHSIDFYELLDSSKHKEKFCERRSSMLFAM